MVTPSRGVTVPVTNSVVMGHYEVEGVLGRGGMGVVLAARDRRTQRPVAIKVLEVGGETNIGRFDREARVVAALESDHLAKFIESGWHAGMPYIVMERLEGEDYGAIGGRALLPLTVVADCILQACEALAHAHGAGVIHRDIKASNLFEHRRPDGMRVVKVLDFGISKCREQIAASEFTLTRTREGVFLGSPRYMSPEQFRNPRRVDGRADIWSLGIVAYRLLSGTFPYAGETSVDVFAAILETKPPTLRELGIDVPPAVDEVIARCLTRKREERFTNAAELARAFAPFASPRWQPLVTRIEAIVRAHPPVLAESLEQKARVRAEEVAMQRTVTVSGRDEDSGARAVSPPGSPMWDLDQAPARPTRNSSTPPPESHSRQTPRQQRGAPAESASDPLQPMRPIEPFTPMDIHERPLPKLPLESDEPIEPTAIIEPTVFIQPSELMKKQAPASAAVMPVLDPTEPVEVTQLLQAPDSLDASRTTPIAPKYLPKSEAGPRPFPREPLTPVPPSTPTSPSHRDATVLRVRAWLAVAVLLFGLGIVLAAIAVRHGRLSGGSTGAGAGSVPSALPSTPSASSGGAAPNMAR